MTRKEMERQAKAHYQTWKHSEGYGLESVYKRFSHEKLRAWRYCVEMSIDLGGHGLRIITYNKMIFTVGFEYQDGITGEARFYYITPRFECTILITPDML